MRTTRPPVVDAVSLARQAALVGHFYIHNGDDSENRMRSCLTSSTAYGAGLGSLAIL